MPDGLVGKERYEAKKLLMLSDIIECVHESGTVNRAFSYSVMVRQQFRMF